MGARSPTPRAGPGRSGGRWTRARCCVARTAGYVGAAELGHQLASSWGIEWNSVRNGVAEITGFPPALLHAFSTRHDQVAEEFAQLVEAGFDPDAATEVAAQRRSRPPKTVLADAAVRSVQGDKLGAIGWTPERVLGLADVAPQTHFGAAFSAGSDDMARRATASAQPLLCGRVDMAGRVMDGESHTAAI